MRSQHLLHGLRESYWRVLAFALTLAVGAGELEAQADSRDDWQRVPDILGALAIAEGSRVADVGAGSGYFTEHLARAVGVGGRVFAVDISERALSQLRERVHDAGLTNVEVIRGEVDDPRLPVGSLDAVLVVNAYHMMTERASMLSGMFIALRPGGRLVIVDKDMKVSTHDSAHPTPTNELSIDLAERDLLGAGFVILERDPEFTVSGHGVHQWLLVARR